MNISPTVETQFLDVLGGRLAYDVSGPEFGRLVLCTPGMGDIQQAYRFMVQPLVTAGHRVVLMDQRGHGQSSSSWAGYGGPLTGQDMTALIRHLGRPAAIIGHSSSAAAALWGCSRGAHTGHCRRPARPFCPATRAPCRDAVGSGRGHQPCRDLEPGLLTDDV